MKTIQVVALTVKGEAVLKSKEIKKEFNLGSVREKFLRKTADAYTTTEYFEDPFRIVVSIKPQYYAFINDKEILDKVTIAVEKILLKHGSSFRDVAIEVLDD